MSKRNQITETTIRKNSTVNSKTLRIQQRQEFDRDIQPNSLGLGDFKLSRFQRQESVEQFGKTQGNTTLCRNLTKQKNGSEGHQQTESVNRHPNPFSIVVQRAGELPPLPIKPIVIIGCINPIPSEPKFDFANYAGDIEVRGFAGSLSECYATRKAKDAVEERYRTTVKNKKKEAEKAAKVQKLKKQEKTHFIKSAVNAIQKEDEQVVQKQMAVDYEKWLAADFELTMHRAINLPNWQKTVKREQDRITRAVTKKYSKYKTKNASTQAPPSTKEVIEAEISQALHDSLCEKVTEIHDKINDAKFGWMVGRREQVEFTTVAQTKDGKSIPKLKDFVPGQSVEKEDWVTIPPEAGGSGKGVGIAPDLAGFLRELAQYQDFRAGTYSGHGGGDWDDRGYSADLFLTGKNSAKDERGFWNTQAAIDFLLALDAVAKTYNAQWRVLYNDFQVAKAVNEQTGKQNVVFMGASEKKLNWHGPHPLKLHFHLDIQFPVQIAPDATKDGVPAQQSGDSVEGGETI